MSQMTPPVVLSEDTTIESLTRERGDAAARLEPGEQAQLDRQVVATQIQMLYANLGTAFGGQILGTLLVAWTVYDTFPLWTVALWFVLSMANQVSRLVLLRQYRRAAPDAASAPRCQTCALPLPAGVARCGDCIVHAPPFPACSGVRRCGCSSARKRRNSRSC